MKTSDRMWPSIWTQARRWLLPMDNGPQEIRVLDGLRAVAALSIVVFHSYLAGKYYQVSWGKAALNEFYFLATGVQLFFVLSGFLLFLPYGRAILQAKPLPSTLRFYKRRALRILPAYWVCLTLLIFLLPRVYHGQQLLQDFGAHVFLIHDDFPLFNQDIEGPFWTLAVEVQFYLALPLLAALLARIVGASRSAARLSIGLAGIIVFALVLRSADSLVMLHIPTLGGTMASLSQIFVLVTMGTQGKFLEVFAVGMLCAVLYVVTVEEKRLSLRVQHRLAWLMLAEAAIMIILLFPLWPYSSPKYTPGTSLGFLGITVPFFIGLGYGSLLLATVWGNQIIRAVFEFYPLRFIGLISYSLYMWHDPIIHPPLIAPVVHLSPKLRIPLAFVVAYLSYQFVERPFLSRRHKTTAMPAEKALAAPLLPPVNTNTLVAQGEGHY